MKRVIKPIAIAWLIGLLLSISGCGVMQSLNPFSTALIVSGETLKASGEQFVKLGKTFKEGCDVTKTIPQSECQAFRAFGDQFQKNYPISVQLWEAARATNYPVAKESAEVVAKDLKGKLDTFEAKLPAKK